MRSRSKRWVKLAATGSYSFEAKAVIGDTGYTAISAPKITRPLMTKPFSVGNCSSATLSVSILTDDEIDPESAIVIKGRLNGGSGATGWDSFGTFWLNTRERVNGLVTLECYDAMRQADQAFLTSEDTEDDWPKSMQEVAENIAARMGVELDARTSIMTGTNCWVPYPDSDTTMKELLGYIGALNGGNWIITEENKLRLVPLVSAPSTALHLLTADPTDIVTSEGRTLRYENQAVTDITDSDETPAAAEHLTDEDGNAIITREGYYINRTSSGSLELADGLLNCSVVCGKLTTGNTVTVTGVKATDDSGSTYTAGDTSGYVLTISSNPYAAQSFVDALYTRYAGYTLQAFTATEALYDPMAELGDQIKISDKVYSVICSETFSMDLSLRIDVSAPDDETLNSKYPYRTLYQQFRDEQENTKKEFSDVHAEIQTTDSSIRAFVKSTYATIESLSSTKEELQSSIELTQESILLTVSSVKTELKEYADTAEADAVSSANNNTANKLKIYSTTTEMNSAIQAKADEISLTVSSVETAANAGIKSSVTLFYASNSTTAPSKPTAAVTTSNSTTRGAWNRSLPSYSASYPYLYTCTQNLTNGGTYSWTNVESSAYANYISTVNSTANTGIKSSIVLFYASSSGTTVPSKPTAAVTTASSTTYKAWNKTLPTYSASYPYLYTCTQNLTNGGTYSWTNVEPGNYANYTSALATRVTNAETSITQNSEAIELRATKTEMDEGLSDKVDVGNVRSNFATETSSVTVTSGSITFSTGTLIVQSDNFTLDEDGNATFSGTMSGGTININSKKFYVDSSGNVTSSGKLTASNVNITGGTIFLGNTTNGIKLQSTGVKIYNSTAIDSDYLSGDGLSGVEYTPGYAHYYLYGFKIKDVYDSTITCMCKTLLWTNPDTSAAFGQYTLTNTSETYTIYDAIYITTTSNLSCWFLVTDCVHDGGVITNGFYSRRVQLKDTETLFVDYCLDPDADKTSLNLIPYKIYGFSFSGTQKRTSE